MANNNNELAPEKIEYLKKELLKQREETLKELKLVEASLRLITQSELAGENSYDEEFADSGTATFEREKDLSLYENLRDVLSRIEKALKRIDEGTYGKCARCGAPIPFERLKAIPYADLCIEDKKKEEGTR